jgi:hypothetical protein
MKKRDINHLGCWVAIGLVCAFLYVWYNYIFFEAWLDINNIKAEDFVANRGFVPYALSLITTVLIVYFLEWLFIQLDIDGFQAGMAIAVAIAFTFSFLNVLGQDLYLFRPLQISLIDGGANLFACLIAGGVLGAWANKGSIIKEL